MGGRGKQDLKNEYFSKKIGPARLFIAYYYFTGYQNDHQNLVYLFVDAVKLNAIKNINL